MVLNPRDLSLVSKKNVWITGIIVFLIFAQAGLAIAYCVRAFQLRKVEYSKRLQVIATLSLGSGVITDITIALALCYFLRKLKTGFRKSDSLVNMLSIYAINTGVLTSALSATVVILYNVYPSAMYFMGSYFVLANVYGISFICTLNTRRVVRGKGTDQSGSSGNTSENGPRNAIFMITNPSIGGHRSNGAPYTGHTTSKGGVEIGVRQEVTIITDIESRGGVDSASTGESTPVKSAARSGYADPIDSVLLYDYEQQSLYAIGWGTGPASQGERLAREDTSVAHPQRTRERDDALTLHCHGASFFDEDKTILTRTGEVRSVSMEISAVPTERS
ncbi:hypothetical protein MD484_g7046, partial [Candolleomyces efflorescens]